MATAATADETFVRFPGIWDVIVTTELDVAKREG